MFIRGVQQGAPVGYGSEPTSFTKVGDARPAPQLMCHPSVRPSNLAMFRELRQEITNEPGPHHRAAVPAPADSGRTAAAAGGVVAEVRNREHPWFGRLGPRAPRAAVTEEVPASPGGLVFQSLVKDALAHEFERRKSLESKGAVLLTASGSMVTLILGLTLLVLGKDFVLANRDAVKALCAALVAFVVSATAAIVVQAFAFKYDVVKQDDLDKIVKDNGYWFSTENRATRDSVGISVETIRSLRKGNRIKAWFLLCSLGSQLLAIALLSWAIAIELWGRLGY